jgi:hypothetical protein
MVLSKKGFGANAAQLSLRSLLPGNCSQHAGNISVRSIPGHLDLASCISKLVELVQPSRAAKQISGERAAVRLLLASVERLTVLNLAATLLSVKAKSSAPCSEMQQSNGPLPGALTSEGPCMSPAAAGTTHTARAAENSAERSLLCCYGSCKQCVELQAFAKGGLPQGAEKAPRIGCAWQHAAGYPRRPAQAS